MKIMEEITRNFTELFIPAQKAGIFISGKTLFLRLCFKPEKIQYMLSSQGYS